MSDLVDAFKRAGSRLSIVNAVKGMSNGMSNEPQQTIDTLKHTWDTVKSGVTAAGDAISGKIPVFDPETGHTSDEMIKRGGDMSTFMGGASAPLPRQGTLGVFGGTLAKTLDYKALKHAQDAANQGALKSDIWQAHGWGRGVDGRWRFEIPDNNLVAKPGVGSDISNPHGALYHPDIAAAYPREARDISYYLTVDPQKPHGGFLNPADRTIVYNAPDIEQLRRGTAHELQHVIQGREGFSPGGSPQEAGGRILDAARARQGKYMDAKNPIEPWAQEYDQFLLEQEAKHGPDPYRFTDAAREAYLRHAGEVEARDAANRLNWTRTSRRETPPWYSQDTSSERQILRRPEIFKPLP